MFRKVSSIIINIFCRFRFNQGDKSNYGILQIQRIKQFRSNNQFFYRQLILNSKLQFYIIILERILQESFNKIKKRSKKICVRYFVNLQSMIPKMEELTIDHTIVIKYCSEYIAGIFLGGRQTFAEYNICEDILLAVSLIIESIQVVLFDEIWKM
ncbi:unnamed protein product [Paramecium sonneborni]|uniref:Uncharacterized protein n=1 Tax=Paramecium sonneborni TaxID=65129 RepID=A0A8S1LXJ1_9CILI|nr:unnamed protein product [Paramecium sonneborni]